MLRRDVSLTPWLQPGAKRRPGRCNRFNGLPRRHAFPGASWPKTGPFPSSAARVYPQIPLRRLFFVFQRRDGRATQPAGRTPAAEKQKEGGGLRWCYNQATPKLQWSNLLASCEQFLLCALRVSAFSLPLRKPPRLPDAVPTSLRHAPCSMLHGSVAASALYGVCPDALTVSVFALD